jgi:Holliday junction resolvase RusA-like endonuclease
MTQRDKWAKRDCVLRYYAFKDEVRLLMKGAEGIMLQPHKVTFVILMPKSWSNKKREEMRGKPHTQKPDVDNLCKAFNDAVLDDDSAVWSQWGEKIWGDKGKIELNVL